MLPRRRQLTLPLLRRESIGNAYHVLTFDDRDGSGAIPGQFVMVRGAEWGDAPLLPRPMSYLSGGTEPSFLVKVVGEGTQRMARAEPGEPFTLLGPLGQPWRAPTLGRKPVLVAGGVGVAPLVFLARARHATCRSTTSSPSSPSFGSPPRMAREARGVASPTCSTACSTPIARSSRAGQTG
jgi:NAD(P)H-flavin reductase